jgi:hypothetical protein
MNNSARGSEETLGNYKIGKHHLIKVKVLEKELLVKLDWQHIF